MCLCLYFRQPNYWQLCCLRPGNLPENLQTSKAVRNSSYSLDRVSFRGSLLSVISPQQLKANNYNLFVTLLFSLILNGSPFIVNTNFTKKKIYFFVCLFFSENKKYMVFSTSRFKKTKNTTEMLKPSSEEPSQYRAQSCNAHRNAHNFPKAPLTFFPGLQERLWFAHGAQH